ncbi:calcium-binding protein [Pseudovibrio brasiliensis]|uniref:Calcium-binding protein n=1 Tax=Pseudovibrio brasiliensis TaxID=1898042 RepID=A0ABX8AT20_9HYPH|nr:calcium-binding protein [Pseudovibrio brasiliensis]QUS56811.1 calcium-binding protein [Pseudovibrio brasiliensis]
MAAEKMPLEGDNSYGFKRGVGKDYFGGAPGITTIRFDGDLTLSDFKIRLEGGDLVFYLIDPANPNQPLSEIADVFYFDNWIANDHGIERFEFSDGTAFSDLTVSSSGQVRFFGTDTDDVFVGTDANEDIYGSAGADTIDGGGGHNTIRYNSSSEGVTVNLVTGEGSGGDAEGDQLSNIQSVYGSEHDDVIIGDAGNNGLYALGGNDRLEGGAGNDWLNAYGSGDNYLDGGSGNDTVRYRWSTSAVTVNLADQTKNEGDAAGDTFVSIENVMGSDKYSDHITGDAGNNKLWGYGGDDTLDGGDGNDTLLGGNGNDVLKAGNGDDHLDGGAGDDEFHYGEGSTTFRYDLGDGNDTIHVNHDVDASYNDKVVFGPGISPTDVTVTRQGEGTDKYGNERDNLDLLLTFKDGGTLLIKEAFFYGPNGFAFGELHFSDGTIWNWESFNKMRFENASDEGEKLAGTLGDDVIDGQGGDDDIVGYSGDDHLIGGAGNDTLDGAEGNDHLEGGTGDDTLKGWTGNNILDGGDGNDTFFSTTDGEDTIIGGSGDDTIYALSGTSIITGGTGDDDIDISSSTVTIHYDLGDGNDTVDITHSDDSSYNNKIIFGAAISPDEVTVTRTGGTSTNLLLTFKDGGTITLYDAFHYGPNYFTFGELHFANGTVWNWETFNEMRFENAGDEGEELAGTLGDDVIDGRGGDDKIDGYTGDDHLIGGAGNDTLQGHDGDDHLEGGAGNDKLSSSAGNNILDGGDGNDTFFSITYGEDQILGGSGDDTIYAVTGASVITGGEGDDTINVSTARVAVHYDLGDGNDIVDFWYPERLKEKNHKVILGSGISSDEVTLTRANGTSTSLLLTFKDGGTLQLKSVIDPDTLRLNFGEIEFADGTIWNWEDINERLLDNLSDQADHIGGTNGDDIIDALGGDDRIYGEDGNDHISGGDGNDIIIGGDGNDVLNGGDGNDTLNAGEGDDHLEGGAGDDTLEGYSGKNILDGGDGDDVIVSFSSENNKLLGGAGNDNIFAHGGSSIIEGGTGDDFIFYRSKDATFLYNLGDGNDTLEASSYAVQPNKIVFGADILPSSVVVAYMGEQKEDLQLTFADGGTIVIIGAFHHRTSQFDFGEFHFADGTIWTGDDISQKLEMTSASQPDEIVTQITLSSSDEFYSTTLAEDHIIFAGAGDDIIESGGGDDQIHGQAGSDTLTGGEGNDAFYFGANFGKDVIKDFTAGAGSVDTIHFSEGTFDSYADVIAAASEVGGDTVIQLDNDNSLTLQNVSIADLRADDFAFA